jgi:hypothetical protein
MAGARKRRRSSSRIGATQPQAATCITQGASAASARRAFSISALPVMRIRHANIARGDGDRYGMKLTITRAENPHAVLNATHSRTVGSSRFPSASDGFSMHQPISGPGPQRRRRVHRKSRHADISAARAIGSRGRAGGMANP